MLLLSYLLPIKFSIQMIDYQLPIQVEIEEKLITIGSYYYHSCHAQLIYNALSLFENEIESLFPNSIHRTMNDWLKTESFASFIEWKMYRTVMMNWSDTQK